MIAYKMFWLLKTEEYLYLMTAAKTEACAVTMTAAKPKKVSRTMDLELDPDNTFLMYQARSGGILWKRSVTFCRDGGGKLMLNVTDILREVGLEFTFCEPGAFKSYKARTWELSDNRTVYDWGILDAGDGFALDSPAWASLSFFPESCYICGSEIRGLSIHGFGWDYRELLRCVRSMKAPFRVDEHTACRWLDAQGPLSKLLISSSRIRIAAHMFFMSSFQVEGFGQNWECGISDTMFQEDCAPCKTHRFGPLLCRLLEAEHAGEVERALQWAAAENILKSFALKC